MATLSSHGVYTREDLIRELGVSNDTIKQWEDKHGFPGRTVGKTTFYDIDKIKEWIRQGEVK